MESGTNSAYEVGSMAAMRSIKTLLSTLLALTIFVGLGSSIVLAAGGEEHADDGFPMPLEEYHDPVGAGIVDVLMSRARENPFNVIGTAMFLCAIIHTFLVGKINHWAHHLKHEHEKKVAASRAAGNGRKGGREEVSFKAEMAHFLGEVEAVFGLWVLPLILAITFFEGFKVAEEYVAYDVNFTEPLFVVVIMTIASTRPVLKMSEACMGAVARIGGGTPAAWWFSILVIGPLLGSFITEPAAMTISALLLARKFYDVRPSNLLKYATLGLLFVNISIGGTLTHFAAPPVLMVAGRWQWDLSFMLANFGWKAAIAILGSTSLYFLALRKHFKAMEPKVGVGEVRHPWQEVTDFPIPRWIYVSHLLFLGWTVLTAHYPALFIGGFLFFIAFAQATYHHQEDIRLRPALLVGFFLAGLVIHGNLQQWWIQPVLSALDPLPLMLGAMVLTAFNDNAAITYLATLVPGFTPELKYAVVAGAVAGGGLTVIANAPNPAGQSILSRFFDGGVSPLYLFYGAAIPTVIVGVLFWVL